MALMDHYPDRAHLTTRSGSMDTEDQETSSLDDLLQEARRNQEHTVLNLNYKGLVRFPSQLTDGHHFRHVQNIYAKRNLISSLPSAIHRLQGLRILYLHSNNLTSLPEELSELNGLESLDVSHNLFTTFPDAVCRCSRLKSFYASFNQLSSIPPDIGQLKQLTQLNLMNNSLSMIPPEIGQCSSLEALHLDRNRLQYLPRQLTLLHGLKELSVTGNRLLVLPMMLGWMPNLQQIYVDSNPSLCTVPFSLYSRPVGVSRCGSLRPPEEKCIHVGPLCGVLPPEIQVCYDWSATKDQPSTLLESAYSTVHKYRDELDVSVLPKPLASLVKGPTAYCAAPSCSGRPIFTQSYVHLLQIEWVQNYVLSGNDAVCLMGLCCSRKCLQVFRKRPIPS